MSNNFHVGQRVVCIKRGLWVNMNGFPVNNQPSAPQYGEVYTVTSIVSIDAPEPYITLGEIHGGWMWNATRFRPVTTRTTDITVFQELQTPKLESV